MAISARGAFGAEHTKPGLIATCADGNHRIVAVAPIPDVAFKENESIHPQLAPAFTADWAGVLKITQRAKYTIALDGSAADATISLDDHPLSSNAIDLDIGDHALRIHFARKPGPARLQLVWQSDFFAREPVPPSALAHAAESSDTATSADIEEGQRLVEELNCIACHHTNSKTLSPRQAPDLSTIGTRLHPEWIAKWLENPKAFRHTALMPTPPLSGDDRRDVSAYLATLKDPENKIKEQPQPSRMQLGEQTFQNVGCTACHGEKGVPLGALGSKWLTGQLAAYLVNPLAIDHSGRMPSMLLQREEAEGVAEFLSQSKDPAYEAKLEGGDPARGQQLVQTQGCLNCHTIESPKGKPLAATAPVARLTPLEQLQTGKGCLADHPAGGAMNYSLEPRQRALIVAFIDSVKQHAMITAAPVYEFYHKTRTLGCLNCHELNDLKPPDESERIPHLTLVGARLRKEAIHQVLTQKQRVHTWLRRRMPDFGPANVDRLADEAVAAAGAADAESLPVPSRDEIAAGQKLMGVAAGGLGCITCHGYNGGKPNVIDDTRGPDVDTFAQRLRPDHFRRWLLDPKRVDPATPMPNFFDAIAHDEATTKVETIFHYVALASNMPPPTGWIDKNNYTIAVHDDPVVMRAFLPNPGGGPNFPRGIAVGTPELINYAFDASTCTLRYAWTGGFIDMQPSWSGRGGNMIKIMGRRFYATSIFPLRVGDSESQPKPQFEGYVIGPHKLPQFLYRLGDVEVRETISVPPRDQKELGLTRTYELSNADKGVCFSVIDEATVSCTATAGQWQPTQVSTPEGKRAGRILRLPAGVTKFAVAITVKESK